MACRDRFSKILTKEFLIEEYVNKQKFANVIADEIGATDTTVLRYLKLYEIPSRNQGQIVKDLTGKKFGKLLVLKRVPRPNKTKRGGFWLCECDCGEQVIKNGSNLRRKVSTSCGCDHIHGPKHGLWKGGKYIPQWYISRLNYKNRGIDFNVSIEYLEQILEKQNFKCALSGEDISFSDTWRSNIKTTASLDRIDSLKGYIEGNVQWVHKDVNYMKCDYTQNRFIEICIKIANKFQSEKTTEEETNKDHSLGFYKNPGE